MIVLEDLADPFRAFFYYNKEQKGSYSIKKVLLAITGKDYSELDINNEMDVSIQYYYSHIDKKLENKEEISIISNSVINIYYLRSILSY